MSKIAVIGDRESILGFMALGFSTFFVEDVASAEEVLRKITREHFSIIYITENFASEMEKTLNEYSKKYLPAVIPIPSRFGSYGLGFSRLKNSVEKAVGMDVL